MSLTRLATPTLLTDQVFAAIRGAIMNGEMPAGSRLRLSDLAARLGTSPMPVRDAIARLEQAGLVERFPHRGAVVVDLGLDELSHVYEARTVLEVEAARLGAARIDAAGVAAMKLEQERMVTAVESGRAAEALDRDEALLGVLYAAGGNPIILELVQGLWRRCRAFKLLGVRSGTEPQRWSSFQAPLITAASSRDGEAAARLTCASLQEAQQRIQQLLETNRRDEVSSGPRVLG